MTAMTERAQARVQAGRTGAPRRKLYIAGEDWTRRIRTVSGAWRPDGSDIAFEAGWQLRGYEGAPVVMWAGYGDDGEAFVPYFEGRLREPEDDRFAATGKAVAWGPFKMLSGSYRDQVVYQGLTIGRFLADIHGRAGNRGRSEVLRGESFVVQREVATKGTGFLEMVDSVLTKANFARIERPRYARLYRPVPRPGATSRPAAHYTPAHYPDGGFRVFPKTHERYHSVNVYRMGQNGRLEVDAWAGVNNSGAPYEPHPSEIFFVSDFPGDQASAQRVAREQARGLGGGTLGFELGPIAFNGDLLHWDSVTVDAEEEDPKDGRRWMVTYECQADAEMPFAVGEEAHDMTLAGTAFEVRRRELAPRRPVIRVNSPGVVVGG